jgi:VanZ family protein
MLKLAHRPLWLFMAWSLVALVTTLSLLPTGQLPVADYNDKLGHVAAYFALMAWFGQLYGLRWQAITGVFGLGILIEILQGLSGYRLMSLADIAANGGGVLLGVALTRLAPDLLVRLEARLP